MTDDLAAMREQMQALTDAANQTLADEQRAITYGSYWIRFYNVKDRVVVFGYVDTIDEMREVEASLGAGEEELDYVVRDTERRHENGYMYGTCYSTMVTGGEPGFTHRADIWPLSQTAYEAAKEVDWDIDSADLPWETKVDLATAYAEYRTHTMGIHGLEVTDDGGL